MKSSISRSAAWLIGPDLDPSGTPSASGQSVLTADFGALLAPAGLARMLAGATSN